VIECLVLVDIVYEVQTPNKVFSYYVSNQLPIPRMMPNLLYCCYINKLLQLFSAFLFHIPFPF
jgi:hypothetical protein